jgi:XTP/dITP diphosphohydrolase
MAQMSFDLVIATKNRGKLREIQALLSNFGVNVLSLEDYPDAPDIVEDGKTFRENALKKARAIHEYTGKPALADDSGLEVDALGREPGVYSARFSGEDADDLKNNELLLRKMKDVPDEKRGAQFTCFMALVGAEEFKVPEKVVKGVVRGYITREKRGPRGFGYDPLFYYSRAKQTFAEMGSEEKNRVSHRARALKAMRDHIELYLIHVD